MSTKLKIKELNLSSDEVLALVVHAAVHIKETAMISTKNDHIKAIKKLNFWTNILLKLAQRKD